MQFGWVEVGVIAGVICAFFAILTFFKKDRPNKSTQIGVGGSVKQAGRDFHEHK